MVYESRGVAIQKTMPDGPIKSFKSTLELVEGQAVVGHRVVEVNSHSRTRATPSINQATTPKICPIRRCKW